VLSVEQYFADLLPGTIDSWDTVLTFSDHLFGLPRPANPLRDSLGPLLNASNHDLDIRSLHTSGYSRALDTRCLPVSISIDPEVFHDFLEL